MSLSKIIESRASKRRQLKEFRSSISRVPLSCPVWLIAMRIFSATWAISRQARSFECRLRERRSGACATSRSGCLKVSPRCAMPVKMISVTGNSLCATRINAGWIDGPRMQSSGNFISLNGGHGDSGGFIAPDQELPRRPNIADTVDDVARAARRDIKYGADWIKLMGTGGVLDLTSDFKVQELSEEQMAKAVEIAHRAGKRVMVHAEGTEGIKAAVRAGVDSIEHGTMLDDEGAALMAKKGTWLVPTLYTFQHGVELGTSHGQDPISLAKVKEIVAHQEPAFTRALKAHLKIAVGIDDEPQYLPKELEALVRGGMTPLEALQAATIRGAELLNWSDRIGTIEAGKFADIIAIDGDPTKDINAIEKVIFVMKDGAVFKNDLAPKVQ
ncbi:MAG: hypothetical protein DMF40_02690 [Verrucomicrobia bacterium]|nr:MAG: hypothetical protein DMF40_02690 [Verrucomicrobiota bacterium]